MARRKKPVEEQLEDEVIEDEVLEEEETEEEVVQEEETEETQEEQAVEVVQPVVEADPTEAVQPCCLPQHDPTLRSARTTKQAQEMVRTMQNNNPK